MPIASNKQPANGHSGNCGCAECVYGPFTRNHYFTGKLLVERDFRDEQRYYTDKHLLHQQRLHGEGVVCGLQVVHHDTPSCRDRFVCIKPGLAIDCCGHDILVTRKECVDITQFEKYKTFVKTLAASPEEQGGHIIQICVRYKECPTEEVPVLYDECGCDETACAPNRILESYEFDLIVDPELTSKTHCVPTLGWKGTLPIAGAGPVVAKDAVYLLAPDRKTITQVDTAGAAVQGSLTLPGEGKALAISEDGKTLYVVALDAAPGTKTELWAIDTTAALKLPPTGPGAVSASPASAVELRSVPGTPGKLFSLNSDTGELIFWDVTVTPPVQTASVMLANGTHSLVAGNKGLQAYAIDPATKLINVVDAATASLQPSINLLTQPARLALANATTPDTLFVLDQAGPSANALQVDVPTLLGSQPLSSVPSAAVVSPDNRFVYLVFPDGARARIRPLDLDRLIAGTPEAPGDGPLVDPSAAAPAILPDGSTMYYPETNAATQHSDVALVTVTPHICPDLYDVGDCQTCDQPDCLVLATIQNYRPGFMIEDLPATAGDFTSHTGRIDNQMGRRVLPSTQKIAEVLECLLECAKGGIPGPKGDPGVNGGPGPKGDPGLGLNATLPKIIDIGWDHGGTVLWDQFRALYDDADPKRVLNKIQRSLKQPSLVLYFNEKMDGITRQTFRVSMFYPQMVKQTFTGLYNILNVDLYGMLLPLPGGPATPHTGEAFVSAWAFIPRFEFFADPLGVIAPAWNAFLSTRNADNLLDKLDRPCLRLVLSGDFVYSPNLVTGNYDESRMLDANNIGGQVGILRSRGLPFPPAPMNPSGNLVEGGDFESWFFFEPPKERMAREPKVVRSNIEAVLFGG